MPTGFLYSLPASLFDNVVLAGEQVVVLPAAGGASATTSAAADGDAAAAEAQPPEQHSQSQSPEQQQPHIAPPPQWSEAGATCIACGIGVAGPGFASAAEQRAHFKTDWHRYNAKRRAARKPPIAEDAFDALILATGDDDGGGGDVSSISGSGSDSDSDDDDSDDDGGGGGGSDGGGDHNGGGAAAAAARRRRRHGGVAGGGRPPQVVFSTAAGERLAVWRCLLCADHAKAPPPDSELLPRLPRLRAAPGTWAVLLLRGGHFAGAVFAMKPPTGSGRGGGGGGEPFECVAHKTFHRYVVRAKAGGKQSAKDATGKYARSAGSALRRYNEAALARDVAELLAEWRPLLDSAALLFVHAPSSNAKLVFGAAAAAPPLPGERAWSLDAADPRVRRVPFATRRPTLSELKRCLLLLGAVMEPRAEAVEPPASPAAAVDAAGASGGAPAAAAAAAAADAAPPPQRSPPQPPPQPRRRADDLPPLLKAAKAGDGERVARLLESGAHDPAAVDAAGRTAYQLAANKAVRDALRRAMAAAPDAWDWAAARVPSALTDELEAAQAAKKAEKRAQQRQQQQGKDKGKGQQQREGGEGGGGGAPASTAAASAADDEIAAAMAEIAALSARGAGGRGGAAASGGRRGGAQVGGRGRGPAGAAAPSGEDAARRRERLAAAAEARLQAAQQRQQLW